MVAVRLLTNTVRSLAHRGGYTSGLGIGVLLTLRHLVIVESPAKAKKIAEYLGPDYVVEASIGHIRDLPQRASEIPAEYKKVAWAKEGVDVEHGFEPLYVVHPDKKRKIAELKTLLKGCDELLLATDEDREGEAIAWHLLEVLKPKVPVKRMVFHEITPEAIRAAVTQTRDVDLHLVDAQETRRILDRLFGYRLSPVLWKKIKVGLSAGRVQSVALRLVVERERERMAFTSSSWWNITATCGAGFQARLLNIDGKRLAVGKDFDSKGALSEKMSAETALLDEVGAQALVASLAGKHFVVTSTEESPRIEKPKAPFTTSTLQQDAGRRLGWGAQLTMRVAQRLYENGYITYMRTDSPTLSQTAINAAREAARSLYGADHVAESPRQYTGKAKNAQEAHEAIRPAGESFRTPGEVASEISRDELALYDLIWKRTVASQMADARKLQMRADLETTTADGKRLTFRASGTVLKFAGCLAAYEEARDENQDDEEARRLPPLTKGEVVDVETYAADGHETKPPARYTEPSLVARLEELGIGRPSTFAATLQTIQDRGYVGKRGRALVPSFIGFAVCSLLEEHFARLVDYDFTAEMDADLDRIAAGDEERVAWLTKFYFGQDGIPGLDELTSDITNIDAREVNSFALGEGVNVRVGKFGTFLEQGEGDARRTTSVPDTLAPDELTLAKAKELFDRPSTERLLGVNPATGQQIFAKVGRFGPYVTEVLPEDAAKGDKPKNASVFASMDVETIDLDTALTLLALPRVVGQIDGEDVIASNGPYGPYIKRGSDTRSIASEEQILTITLDEAAATLAQPKIRGRGAPKPPLKELGVDPASGRNVVVKDGRFGAYVTDGESNASLRKTEVLELLTLDRGLELLAERRAYDAENGGVKKKARSRKPAAKKAVTKKTPAKKAVARKPAKKLAAKASA
jgi:DNA topoisomerase-1